METHPTMTFDEVFTEKSNSFVKALKELKNLKPQLYSAAEYCEKSYLQSEQKQMVVDTMKDYTGQALVNAVDHVGTVAYKLNDLLEQQTIDIPSVELKVMLLNQKLLTCQTYTDREGLRQQQLLAIDSRHNKHYILPKPVNKKVHFGPDIKMDLNQSYTQARPRRHASNTPAQKTLSWHLGSGISSAMSPDHAKVPLQTFGAFYLSDAQDTRTKFSVAHMQKDHYSGDSKALKSLKSFNRPYLRDFVRTKSVMSAFVKRSKLKLGGP